MSKAQTLKLEKESVAMEQQLQELRVHANNEKNEREWASLNVIGLIYI